MADSPLASLPILAVIALIVLVPSLTLHARRLLGVLRKNSFLPHVGIYPCPPQCLHVADTDDRNPTFSELQKTGTCHTCLCVLLDRRREPLLLL